MKSLIVLAAAVAVSCGMGCSTLQQGQELAQSTGVDQQALKAIEAYAASKGLPISLTKAPAAADVFDSVPATYSEWVDANGNAIAFPISRTVKKEFKETVGATTVSTIAAPPAPPAVIVQPQIPPSTSTNSGQGGGGSVNGLSDAERAALEQLGVAVP